MTCFRLLLGLALLLCSSWALAGPGPQRVAVLPTGFEDTAREVPAALFDDAVLAAVQNIGNYEVIGQDDINAMLGLERQKALLGCDDTTCLAEIGGALGVELLVSVRVARVGSEWACTLKMMDIQAGRVLSRSTDFFQGDVATLLKAVPALINKLLAGGGGASGSLAAATAQPSYSGTGQTLATGEEQRLTHELRGLVERAWASGPLAPSGEIAVAHQRLLEARRTSQGLSASRRRFETEIDRCGEGQSSSCLASATMRALGVGVALELDGAAAIVASACRRGVPETCTELKAYALGLTPELIGNDSARALTLTELCAGHDVSSCQRLRDAELAWRDDAVDGLIDACAAEPAACAHLDAMNELDGIGRGRRVVGYVLLGVLVGAVGAGTTAVALEGGEDGVGVGAVVLGLAGLGAGITGLVLLIKGYGRLGSARERVERYRASHPLVGNGVLLPVVVSDGCHAGPGLGFTLELF